MQQMKQVQQCNGNYETDTTIYWYYSYTVCLYCMRAKKINFRVLSGKGRQSLHYDNSQNAYFLRYIGSLIALCCAIQCNSCNRCYLLASIFYKTQYFHSQITAGILFLLSYFALSSQYSQLLNWSFQMATTDGYGCMTEMQITSEESTFPSFQLVWSY